MTKIVGSIMIIGATSLLGWKMASDVDRTYEEMQYLRRIMCLLQSEISYSRAFLAEAFFHISRNAKSPYNVWLRQLYCCMESHNEGDFETIWNRTISQYLVGVHLPEKEIAHLRELGQYLGTSDIEIQVRHIELFEEQIGIAMKEMREELRTKKRLYHSLGVMSGIFLAIMLI